MKILGISNPNFQGVTIATKALTAAYYGLPHLTNKVMVNEAAATILNYKPELLIIGGWSMGYDQLLEQIADKRDFPVVCIYHGTWYHEEYFGGDYLERMMGCLEMQQMDLMSFVHPRTTQYYRDVLKMHDRVVWLPHYFRPEKKVDRVDERFNIGIFGGTKSWYKNALGPVMVAQEYARDKYGRVKVDHIRAYNDSHTTFLKRLEQYHLLIHASFLECYSNTVQEARARGIPVIMSSANAGLYNSPFIGKKDWIPTYDTKTPSLVLEDAIDPVELTNVIGFVDKNWQSISLREHGIGNLVYSRARKHTQEMLKFLVEEYKKGTVRKNHQEYGRPFAK